MADRPGYLQNYQASHDRGDLSVRVRATSKIFAHKPLTEQLQELMDLRETYLGDRVSLHSARFFLISVEDALRGYTINTARRDDCTGSPILEAIRKQLAPASRASIPAVRKAARTPPDFCLPVASRSRPAPARRSIW